MTALTAKQIADSMARHAAIVGTVGSGKTFTAKGIVEELIAAGRRVCVLDPTGAWWGLRASADGKKAGLPVAIFGGEHADVPINEHSGEAVAKVIATRNLPAVIDMSEMMLGERQRFATEFAAKLFALNKGPLHLVIDEADEFAPQTPLPEHRRMLHQFDRIVRRGRIKGFRVILITQRPAVIHKNVLTQLATLIALKLTSPQDRKAVEEWIKGNADEGEATKVLKSLASLPLGEGWVWAPGAGILARHKFPRIKTFDSSRTPDDDETIEEPTKLADVDVSEIRATFAAATAEKDGPSKTVTVMDLDGVRAQVAKARDDAFAEARTHMIPKTKAANEVGALLESFDRLAAQLRGAMEKIIAGFSGIDFDAMASYATADLKVGKPISGLTAAASGPREFVASGKFMTPPAKKATGAAGNLPQGERAILVAVAQSGGYMDRTNLSLLTGYKKTTRDLYIRRLASQGYLEHVNGGEVGITKSGTAALGRFDPLPVGVALRDYWLQKLPTGESQILRQVWGNDLSRDQISEKTGYKNTTRDLYLRRLAAMKLITYTERGRVHAASALYD